MMNTSDHHEYCTGGFSPDDIVISGISGRFPLCDSIGEFLEALMTKKDLLVPNTARYQKGAAELPFSSSGTLNNVDKFDANFFGFTSSGAEYSDPSQRCILEVSYEAMADAGYDPLVELRGANIGVYTAITNQDAKEIMLRESDLDFNASHAAGYLRCMIANRCSYIFDFHGPSFTMDTACSSSFVALHSAFNDIRDGRIDAALVNGCQLCLDPYMTSFYYSSGIISPSASCNTFDARADGIVRTEAVTALFLQKAGFARRAYASILGIKHSSTGYVREGVYVPSLKEEIRLFQDVLRDTRMNVNDIQYVETHGTGTFVGDPIEIKAVETAYCKDREEPLYIGSVKSNAGHAEAAAGHCGTIKVILAFETGVIAPNQGYEKPNPNCEALVNGTLKIVEDPLPLTSPYIPISCFGFGGSINHGILKRNPIEYSSDPDSEDLPRLVLYPATTESAVLYLFDYIQKHPELRSEFFALLNKLSFTPTVQKPFRGYALFQKDQPVIQVKNCLTEQKREVWFVMTGMGCQWAGMGLEMMQIKIFADSMKKSASVLKPLGIDLFELLKLDGNSLLMNRKITLAFVSIAAIQIALIDVLRALEIHPDGMIGHSTGELICAYADGCCNAEQTILSAYWRGRSVEEANLITGAMAAVGLTWEEATRRCPEGVYPACHNAEDSVTVSGPKETVEKFVTELQQENIFARVVNAYGYAFHSQHIWPASKALIEALKEIICDPKPRSERWISSSYPEDEWDSEDCKIAGAEYFVHNLMSVVRFSDMLKRIPSNAITIEIGPHFLLQSILKRSIGLGASYIGLMKRNDNNNVGFFLESVGKLYFEGLNPKIENLYKPVKFPVPRNTPFISDLIQWDHSQSWDVPKWKTLSRPRVHVFHTESTDNYLLDHFIDGRPLFPATGYVFLAWKALAKQMEKKMDDINVLIEDFKIHRAVMLNTSTNPRFTVSTFSATGNFEIEEGKTLVATGKIREVQSKAFAEPPPQFDREQTTFISGGDIYNELKIHGYEYGPEFRRLVETSLDGKEGFVEWNGKWIPFLDALLIFFMFSAERTFFKLPTGFRSIKVSSSILKSGVEECQSKNLPGLPVSFNPKTRKCQTAGVEIVGLDIDSAPQHAKSDNCIYEEYKFVPYVHTYEPADEIKKLEKYLMACNKIINVIEHNLTKSGLKNLRVETKNDYDVDDYIKDLKDEHWLLFSSLKEFADADMENLSVQQRKDIFQRYVKDLGKDVANSLLVNEYCLRFMFDIVLENSFRKFSVLEVNNNFPVMLPTIVEAVEKYSMVKFKSKILVCESGKGIDEATIRSCNIQLHSGKDVASVVKEKSQGVVISFICSSDSEEVKKQIRLLSSVVEENGFIMLFHKSCALSQEETLAILCDERIDVISHDVLENLFEAEELVIVSKISNVLGGNLYLFRHAASTKSQKLIKMTDGEKWFEELQSSIVNWTESLWILSENCSTSGIVGMINCLRHEPGGDRIRCVFIPNGMEQNGSSASFSLIDPIFNDVIQKDLVMNVYKDGSWGSFRHIRVEKELTAVEVDHSYLNIQRYGDLSSFMWIESSLNYNQTADRSFVHIYYSALNFRDVMIATGKLSAEAVKGNKSIDNCVLGFEFSGRNKHGERIFGVCLSRGLATATDTFPKLTWPTPDHWRMEEAVTVPVVYLTCYYALFMRARLEHGESILIHSGTGGIGLAAINIAISLNCEIYTTVGTEEKRQYLLKKFPSIKPENIGCSRNTTFEDMIMNRTNGKGVDVVLNSLADDKFHASIRCVADHGRFVEIGKYDLALDHKIGLKFFLRNISFHAVLLDKLMNDSKMHQLNEVREIFMEGIRNGVVKPLDRTVFSQTEVEKAFRYMGSGVHIGKVILKIRDEEKELFSVPTTLRTPAIPVTYFYPYKVYIIIGGLGGFGIEVANWLLEKGARNIVLTSRYGARTPYHHLCLKRWNEEGYNVTVSTKDVSIKSEAIELIKEVAKTGPVGGIFNSAVVLNDAFLENMNYKSFKEVCAPKADATINLDSLSRCLCPELDHFVCFSSISCGRGNAGQMNYGYANSVMERICEQRQADGFPGLAIQWGIIGEVGVVHRHMGDDAMIAGVGAQRVKSCLEILNVSCQMKRPVVCSYAIKDSNRKKGDLGDTLQQLARIFGLKDVSEFNSVRSFREMGVDSMIGVEVKHLLETACNTTFTAQEIQELKIEDVKALLEKAESEKNKDSKSALVSTVYVQLPKSCVHSQAVIPLNEIKTGSPVFILDLDCSDLSELRVLGAAIDLPMFGLLLSSEAPLSNLKSLACWYLDRVKEVSQENVHIVAHSTASVLGLEMILQSQKGDKNILSLTILDGYSSLTKILNGEAETSENDIILDFIENYIPAATNKLREELSKATNFEQQVRLSVDLFTKSSAEAVNKTELSEIIKCHVNKVQVMADHVFQGKLQKDLMIIEDSSKLLANDVAEVKRLLSQVCSGNITIQRIPDASVVKEDNVQKIASVLKSVF